ncbi:MAG: C39 family peptidase [Candidatus Buchananbacteria bacterium]
MSKAAFFVLLITSIIFLFYGIHLSIAKQNENGALLYPLYANDFKAIKTDVVQKIASIPKNTNINDKTKLIIHDVGFISQAPRGNWSDARLQDGCEEASSLMAFNWATKQNNLSAIKAEEKIVSISNWEKQKIGIFKDTSVQDTADKILSDNLGFNNYEVKKDISINDIKNEIYNGNIIIIPADGRKLNNPNFRPPGPLHHMLLIIGYDPGKKEFITNDPGTRLGEKYRYSEKIIDNALRDYPTGNHLKTNEIKKNIIVVKQL